MSLVFDLWKNTREFVGSFGFFLSSLCTCRQPKSGNVIGPAKYVQQSEACIIQA